MNQTVTKLLQALKWVILVALYGAVAMVIRGIFTMEAPETIFPSGTPPVSPAVGATVNLTSQFFIVYIAQAVVRSLITFKGPTPQFIKLLGVFQLACYTLNMAPMLAILFIGARMRALTIDPLNGNPQVLMVR